MVSPNHEFSLWMLAIALLALLASSYTEGRMTPKAPSSQDNYTPSSPLLDSTPTAHPRPRFSVRESNEPAKLPILLKVDEADPAIHYYLNTNNNDKDSSIVTNQPFSICQVIPNTNIPLNNNCVQFIQIQPKKSMEKIAIPPKDHSNTYHPQPKFSTKDAPNNQLLQKGTGIAFKNMAKAPIAVTTYTGTPNIITSSLGPVTTIQNDQYPQSPRKIRDLTGKQDSLEALSSTQLTTANREEAELYGANSADPKPEENQVSKTASVEKTSNDSNSNATKSTLNSTKELEAEGQGNNTTTKPPEKKKDTFGAILTPGVIILLLLFGVGKMIFVAAIAIKHKIRVSPEPGSTAENQIV